MVARMLLCALAAIALGLGGAASAHAQRGPATAAVGGETPKEGALYDTGHDGKHLLGGDWLFRLDDADQGLAQGFQTGASTDGWGVVQTPHVWNAQDLSDQSMLGSVGWYRKDFRLPRDRKAVSWNVRFESANYRLRAWLNGREIGAHEGNYLAFELPLSRVKASGVNTLVVRIDSRTNQFDLPPGGLDDSQRPDGGWWNYGGLPREVYLRRVTQVDLEDVHVRSSFGCRACDARVQVTAKVRNRSRSTQRPKLTGSFGKRGLNFRGPARLRPGQTGTYTAKRTEEDPDLWSPGTPTLYKTTVNAAGSGGAARQSSWTEKHGIRSLQVLKGGRFRLNFRSTKLRGASLHEDDPAVGSALAPSQRRADFDLLTRLGATVTRAHYPLHPYSLELADELGILVWSQAPVYQLREPQLGNVPLRRKAVRYVREQVMQQRDHPSVFSYSLVNELPARPGSGQESLITEMARAVRQLDSQRLVALDVQGYPTVGPQEPYRLLDAIGINDYFGWYPGPEGSIADRNGLGPYLDQLHIQYPDQALFVTEFGAEANREGPLDEKGTYAFQRDFLRFHLGVFDSKPYLNGAMVWILRDFRVKPGWEGGNPKPTPPVNFKGLVDEAGNPKPAFDEVQRIFRGTRQVG